LVRGAGDGFFERFDGVVCVLKVVQPLVPALAGDGQVGQLSRPIRVTRRK
jgi:hypothetical protein